MTLAPKFDDMNTPPPSPRLDETAAVDEAHGLNANEEVSEFGWWDCDECEHRVTGPSMFSRHHASWCSLNPANVVDMNHANADVSVNAHIGGAELGTAFNFDHVTGLGAVVNDPTPGGPAHAGLVLDASETAAFRESVDSRGAGGAVCAAAGPGWVIRAVLREPSRTEAGGCDLWVTVLEAPHLGLPEPWAFVLLHVDAPRGVWEQQNANFRASATRRAVQGAVTAATAFELFNLIDNSKVTWSGTTNGATRCTWHTPPTILGRDLMCGVPGLDGDAIRMLAAFGGTSPPQFRAGGSIPSDGAVFDAAQALRTWSNQVDAHHLDLVTRRHRPGRTPVTAEAVVETLTEERNSALMTDDDLLTSVTFLSGGITLTRLLEAVDRWFESTHPVPDGRTPACACLHILNSRRRT